jgi:pimeloyl-ACP methyl ester carboxylesterase
MEEYVSNYGGVIHGHSTQLMLAMMLRFFTSPEYSLPEAFNTIILLKGREFTMQAMWQDIQKVNLTQEIPSIHVPLYFFAGQYDMATPLEPVKTFYNAVTAEHGKTLIMFEHSAHFVMVEEQEKYQDALVNIVLKESLDK